MSNDLLWRRRRKVEVRKITEVKIDVYGRPVTANAKLQVGFSGEVLAVRIRIICALLLKNGLTKNLPKPSKTCRTYLQIRFEVCRLRLSVCHFDFPWTVSFLIELDMPLRSVSLI